MKKTTVSPVWNCEPLGRVEITVRAPTSSTLSSSSSEPMPPRKRRRAPLRAAAALEPPSALRTHSARLDADAEKVRLARRAAIEGQLDMSIFSWKRLRRTEVDRVETLVGPAMVGARIGLTMEDVRRMRRHNQLMRAVCGVAQAIPALLALQRRATERVYAVGGVGYNEAAASFAAAAEASPSAAPEEV